MSVSRTTKAKDTAIASRTRIQKITKSREEKTMAADSAKTKNNGNKADSSQMVALTVQGSSDDKSLEPLPGDRPVGSSHLEIAETFTSAGVRPIEASHLKFTETENNMGIRPVASSNLAVVETIHFSGIRPVTASTLKISETMLNFGSRPIASNDIDAGQDIMGFLD